MGIVLVIALIIGVALLPFILLGTVIGLAIFIWCWQRIGRYFINFGRWLGDWRNFIPLSVLGLLCMIFVFIIFPIVGLSPILIVTFIILFILVTVVIFLFVLIVWIGQFFGWFWPRWRRLVWSGFVSVWGSMPARSGEGTRRRPRPTTEGPTHKRPPEKRSGAASLWDLFLGKPPQPAKSTAAPQPGVANVQPPADGAPAKRSWFGTFWALMLGKPQPKRQQTAKPTSVQTTEQTLGPSGGSTTTATAESGASAAPRARRAKPSKRPWFGSFWALMLGKPSKPSQRKVQPEKATDGSTHTTVAADAKTGATTRATATTSGKKQAKRGFFAGIWNSIVRGVTFVVGLVIIAVLWVVQKLREGIEWIRVRLNLD